MDMKACWRTFDAHCHLSEPIDHSDGFETGMEGHRAAVCGTRRTDWFPILELAKVDSHVTPLIGLHPWFVSETWPEDCAVLQNELIANPNLGIGETGLDFQSRYTNQSHQEASFAVHLELACRYNRPVAVHCVRAWGRLLELLRVYPAPRVLLHSFGGAQEMVPELISLNCWFSFSGLIVDPASKRMRASVASVPADRLLVETDSLDRAVWRHPETLMEVMQVVAQLRGESFETVLTCSRDNATRFFNVI